MTEEQPEVFHIPGVRVVTVEEAEAWMKRVVEKGFSPSSAANMADMMRYMPVIWGMYRRIIIQGRERKAQILEDLHSAVAEDLNTEVHDLVNGAGEKVGEVKIVGPCPHCGAPAPETAADVIQHGNECPGLG